MDETPGSVRGSCSCGAVRFELRFPTRFVAHCHCANCRRAHGAGVVTFAGVPEAQFELLAGRPKRWTSEKGSVRGFCGECGSTLVYSGPAWPGEVHVAVGCVEGELDRAPMGHAFADEAPSWCPITDDLPT